MEKRPSLFVISVSDEEKQFCTFDFRLATTSSVETLASMPVDRMLSARPEIMVNYTFAGAQHNGTQYNNT
jgi:hypothetical protein